LLEALTATAFLGIALMAFAANTVALTRNEKTADSTSAAHALAQQKLEQLRSMPLGAAQTNPGLYADATTMKADGSASGPFTRSWVVSANNVPTWGMRTATVTISWRDSRAHTTRVSTFLRCSTIPCA
jgi:Tfp pilus assembly protein PilV